MNTPFSDFIRNASLEEKERVYLEVMKRSEISMRDIAGIILKNRIEKEIAAGLGK